MEERVYIFIFIRICNKFCVNIYQGIFIEGYLYWILYILLKYKLFTYNVSNNLWFVYFNNMYIYILKYTNIYYLQRQLIFCSIMISLIKFLFLKLKYFFLLLLFFFL